MPPLYELNSGKLALMETESVYLSCDGGYPTIMMARPIDDSKPTTYSIAASIRPTMSSLAGAGVLVGKVENHENWKR